MLPDLDKWLEYFRANALADDHIEWGAEGSITPEERDTMAASMAAFQLGEYSEGRGLMKFARAYAEEHNDEKLVEITRCFVKEEQNHAGMLKRFMEMHHIPLLTKNWTDTVFRKLRKHVGYELSITILITAEIIALTYYKALANCTGSELLKSICRKILSDEKAHVEYESSLINYIRREHGWLRRLAVVGAHRFLYFGTVLVVIFEHRSVVKAGRYTVMSFWASCWRDFNLCFNNSGKSIIELIEGDER